MSEPQFQLIVRKGPQVGQLFHLDAISLVIGRDPMCDITINDPEISRQHARLSRTGDGFQIEDLGSTNGTFVNGQRLASNTPFALQPGQAINMGSGVRLVYEAADTPGVNADTMIETPPIWESGPPEEQGGESQDELLDEFELPLANDPPATYNGPKPEPYLQRSTTPPTYTPPTYSEPAFVPSGREERSNRQRNLAIVVAAILLLCCCCTFLVFMYQWGGDWLMNYLGLY